jgi:hypothetical protein
MAAGQGTSPDRIAADYLLPVAAVQGWITSALNLERETRYDRFRLVKETHSWFSQPVDRGDEPPSRPRNYRRDVVREVLQGWLAEPEGPNQTRLRDGLNLWKRYYQKHRTALYLETADQAETWVAFLRAMGIPAADIYLQIPSNFPESDVPHLGPWLAHVGLQETQIVRGKGESRVRSPNSGTPDSVPGITIRHGGTDANPMFSTEWVYHYLFLASIVMTGQARRREKN